MPEVNPDADVVLELAEKAEQTLGKPQDLKAWAIGLGHALETARQLRAQVDLGGAVTPERLIRVEALFRATIGLQPTLQAIEVDGAIAALEAKGTLDDEASQAADLRARSYVAAQALLGSLQAAYQVAFDSKETPWPSR